MQNKEARRYYKSIAREVEQLKKEVNSTREIKGKWNIFASEHLTTMELWVGRHKTKEKTIQAKSWCGHCIKSIIVIGHCLGVDMSY